MLPLAQYCLNFVPRLSYFHSEKHGCVLRIHWHFLCLHNITLYVRVNSWDSGLLCYAYLRHSDSSGKQLKLFCRQGALQGDALRPGCPLRRRRSTPPSRVHLSSGSFCAWCPNGEKAPRRRELSSWRERAQV